MARYNPPGDGATSATQAEAPTAPRSGPTPSGSPVLAENDLGSFAELVGTCWRGLSESRSSSTS